ncbi:hypothetical protein Y032_0203g1811 [Ancylostoma ceylanicum]|uniref:Uncharacterized protein n=1 Tax=Ancylostoma ceylanicum TaxID=53326 RepID=A0A016SMS8_9BILA|nr:hypothetical protein Y032_0203g1811 [Ancylostoma ceylanicum]
MLLSYDSTCTVAFEIPYFWRISWRAAVTVDSACSDESERRALNQEVAIFNMDDRVVKITFKIFTSKESPLAADHNDIRDSIQNFPKTHIRIETLRSLGAEPR